MSDNVLQVQQATERPCELHPSEFQPSEPHIVALVCGSIVGFSVQWLNLSLDRFGLDPFPFYVFLGYVFPSHSGSVV